MKRLTEERLGRIGIPKVPTDGGLQVDRRWKTYFTAPKEGAPPDWIAPGFALPMRFVVKAQRDELDVTVTVGIRDRKAIVTKLEVTGGDFGVTTEQLRSIPLRELVADGARRLVLHAKPGEEPVAAQKHTKESDAAIRKAVRYVKVPGGRP